jgi:hypothetical protein
MDIVLWAQRAGLVYLTIDLPDATSTEINLTENKLNFTAVSEGKSYAVEVEFNGPINTEVCALTDAMIQCQSQSVLFP